MRNILTILIYCGNWIIISGQTYDYPVFDMERLLKKNNIRTFNLWVCSDSSCKKKSKSMEIQYENNKIKSESLFSFEDKVFQFFIYKYDSIDNLIQKDFRTDIGNWIYFKYNYNSSGQLINEDVITNDKVYSSRTNYEYNNSLLISKEYIDSGQYFAGEGKDTFEYDSQKRLITIKNYTTSKITKFDYDSVGNLVYSIEQIIDKPDWEKDINKYTYAKNKLVKQIHEWYNSGNKENIHIEYITLDYYENGLLKSLIKESDGEKIYELATYD